jgi:hypothetical protein
MKPRKASFVKLTLSPVGGARHLRRCG